MGPYHLHKMIKLSGIYLAVKIGLKYQYQGKYDMKQGLVYSTYVDDFQWVLEVVQVAISQFQNFPFYCTNFHLSILYCSILLHCIVQ
jgi:hypothetical protein